MSTPTNSNFRIYEESYSDTVDVNSKFVQAGNKADFDRFFLTDQQNEQDNGKPKDITPHFIIKDQVFFTVHDKN